MCLQFIVAEMIDDMKQHILFFVAVSVCVAALTSCNNRISPDNSKDNIHIPIELTKAESEVANKANVFAFDVYRALYEDGQMLVSPLSLSLALSMTACGANGITAEQMAAVLGFEDYSVEDIAGYYKTMVKSLAVMDKTTTFECANSVWVDNGFPVRKDFLATVKDLFAAEAKNAPFSDPATLDAVNGWCSEKTHGKIENMLSELDHDTVMLLINALYFNGKWGFKFNEKTNKEKYASISGESVNVDMMSAFKDMRYTSVNGWSMVELPYGNGSFQMDVILPPAGMPFGQAAASLDYSLFRLLQECLTLYTVNLRMPEFKFDYSVSGLKDALIALGMDNAFDPSADFSKMADVVPGDAFYIGDVKQKAFIDVNTKGTEAAAVTVVEMKYNSSVPPEPKTVDFVADRPFFFVIREKSTGSILFIGQKVE